MTTTKNPNNIAPQDTVNVVFPQKGVDEILSAKVLKVFENFNRGYGRVRYTFDGKVCESSFNLKLMQKVK